MLIILNIRVACGDALIPALVDVPLISSRVSASLIVTPQYVCSQVVPLISFRADVP